MYHSCRVLRCYQAVILSKGLVYIVRKKERICITAPDLKVFHLLSDKVISQKYFSELIEHAIAVENWQSNVHAALRGC